MATNVLSSRLSDSLSTCSCLVLKFKDTVSVTLDAISATIVNCHLRSGQQFYVIRRSKKHFKDRALIIDILQEALFIGRRKSRLIKKED